MSKFLKPKSEPKLDSMLSYNEFKQITMISSSIYCMDLCIDSTQQGSDRRKAFAEIKKQLLRINANINGGISDRAVIDGSKVFLADMRNLYLKFLRTFEPKPQITRCPKTGRFMKVEVSA